MSLEPEDQPIEEEVCFAVPGTYLFDLSLVFALPVDQSVVLDVLDCFEEHEAEESDGQKHSHS